MSEISKGSVFTKSFTRQEPIPEEAVEQAVALMRTGRLHRYDPVPSGDGEVGCLEQEFAKYIGAPYCLACASGGYALYISLLAAGVQTGDLVLTNAFTLGPVPGAIHNSGARAIFVEMTEDFAIDLGHLERMATESNARFLLLSHMRGHIADMDRILELCRLYNLILIEDCAHTMGACWDDRPSGSDADIACYSTQTYKHINSGEGGLLTTRHANFMAKAVMLSGSYMLYTQHSAGPSPDVYESIRLETPNYSGRMDNLRASILRPQLARLSERCKRWNHLYSVLEAGLSKLAKVRVPERAPKEQFVGSSIQFSILGYDEKTVAQIVSRCAKRGVVLKWFGAPEPVGFTSRYDSWQYFESIPKLLQTERICASLCDMRIPLTFNDDDCHQIIEIIAEEL